MHPSFCLALVTRETDEAILLVKHPQRGWELPGGHCESNESPEQTLTRELAEETGLAGVFKRWNRDYYPDGLVGWIVVEDTRTWWNSGDEKVSEVRWWPNNPEMTHWDVGELIDLRNWLQAQRVH
jgi:8-oxo-dGTP pyrophosphatase MutT (NUDIX family)